MSKNHDGRLDRLASDPFWHFGKEEDFVSEDQWRHWPTEATEQTWKSLRRASVPGFTSPQWVALPLLERIAAFLRRGEPIKPGLAKIIGRLLAGEYFFSPPFGFFDPCQFDDGGNIVRDDTKITKFTLEAWTYRLIDGKVIRACKGQPPIYGRAWRMLHAAEAVLWEMAAAPRANPPRKLLRDEAVKMFAVKFELSPAEVRKGLLQLERRSPLKIKL